MATSTANKRSLYREKVARRKRRVTNFFKGLFIIIVVAGVAFATYSVVTEHTYNKLSELGDFSVTEFVDMNIPKSYKSVDLTTTDKYNKNLNLVVFSNKRCDLLFNLSDNMELKSVEDVSMDLAYGLKDTLLLDDVYHSTMITDDGLNVPIIAFQMETPEGTRYFQYATINSGYKTILISMNSLSDNFKTFTKLLSTLELK